MAVLTGPLHSSEARGRTGDLIYNTYRGVSYVKAHAHYQSGLSAKQQAIQETARWVTQNWHDLPSTTHSQWAAFAAAHPLPHWSGHPKRISAYNWYMKLGWPEMWYFGYGITSPPAALPALIPLNMSVVWDAGNFIQSWTPQTPGPTFTWHIDAWLQGPDPFPQAPTIKRARLQSFAPEPQGENYIADLGPGHYNFFTRAIHASGSCMPFSVLQVEAT